MLQSTKVDVIYFATPTDFEMEFNLGGCCRMRLLTDTAENRKEFVKKLSRAVSRSRIIICCGPLFDEGGLIASVSAAIGKSVEPVDAAAFGIKGNREISVISGALPLVQDGIFGGCIIESGPQTIILLSESRSVRKQIMTHLIHPYIEEKVNRPAASAPAFSLNGESAPETAIPRDPAEMLLATQDADKPKLPENLTVKSDEEAAEDAAEDKTEESAEEPEKSARERTKIKPPVEPVLNDPTAELLAGILQAPGDQLTPSVQLSPKFDKEPEAKPEVDLTFHLSEPEKPAQPDRAKMSIQLNSDAIASQMPDDFGGLFVETKDVRYDRRNYYNMCYELDDEAPEEDGFSFDAPKRALRIPILVFSIILLLCLIVLIYLFLITPLRQGISVGEYFRLLFQPQETTFARILF